MKFGTKISIVFFLSIFSIVLVSGCINQEPEKPQQVLEITKDGITYQFTNNIFDSMKIPLNEGAEIKRLVKYASAVSVVFDNSSTEDNAYFTVINYNMITKLTHYYAYSRGKFVDESFYPVYVINDGKLLKKDKINNTWLDYNFTLDSIEWPVLYLKGPNTGAIETSVTLDYDRKIIYIQGTDYRNLSLAADRFVLEVLGVSTDLLEQGQRDFS